MSKFLLVFGFILCAATIALARPNEEPVPSAPATNPAETPQANENPAQAGTDTTEPEEVPPGPSRLFQQIAANSYITSEFKLNWFEAFAVCRSFGADLATIQSQDELTALSSQLKSSGRSTDTFWIDGNDLSKPLIFFSWNTGIPVPFLKWMPRQPDNVGGNERCLSLGLTQDTAGEFRMNDAVCLIPQHFICKART